MRKLQNMKKIVSAVLISALLLTSFTAFAESKYPGTMNVGTSGTVELVSSPDGSGTQAAKITSRSDADSYVYIPNSDYTKPVYINFRLYVPDSMNGAFSIYLRDNTTIAQNITLLSVKNQKISIPAAEPSAADYEKNTWYSFKIMIDTKNDKIAYYCNLTDPSDETRFDLLGDYNISTAFQNGATHNFAVTSMRFNMSRGTDGSHVFIDNLSLSEAKPAVSENAGLIFRQTQLMRNFRSGLDYTEVINAGDTYFTNIVENTNDYAAKFTFVTAQYDSTGAVKNIKFDPVLLKAKSIAQLFSKFTVSSYDDGDYVKSFIWDKTENISPLTDAYTFDTYKLNYNDKPVLSQTLINEAVSVSNLGFNSTSGNSGNIKSAEALYTLLLATHFDENTKSDSQMYTKTKAIQMIRILVSGGKEPYACVGPYWSHPVVAASMVLAKNTPVVWNSLTDTEKDKVDLLMKCLAIAGNWGYNDQNNYKTGFDLLGNFGKGWNPNYRNSYLSCVLSGALYFGADELDSIFVNFDYDEYIAKLTEYNFTNILATWTVAGKDLMENGGECTLVGAIGSSGMEAGESGGTGKGVKLPFVYNGMTLKETEKIFEHLMRYTYGATVVSSVPIKGTNITASIMNGAVSPYEGMEGMMLEFNSGDAGGTRSSASYCLESLVSVMPTYANFKLFGGWTSESAYQCEVDRLIKVGTEDLFFKIENGYNGYSNGKSTPFQYGTTAINHGYDYVKEIWRSFHLTD